MSTTRQVTDIPLIGNATPEICGNQLPSNKEILQCYFYYTRHASPKLTASAAAKCVVRKCFLFWEYAKIPIARESYVIRELKKLVANYKTILKYGAQKEGNISVEVKVIDFKCMFENLFDIALQKGVDVMKNEAAKTLLRQHREKGRNGHLDIIIDTGVWLGDTPDEEEEKQMELEAQVELGKVASNFSNYLLDEDEDLDELLKQMEDDEKNDADYEIKLMSSKPKRMKIMTPDITATLDRAKVSDRMAARVLAATLIAAKMTLEDVPLSRETVRRNRRKHRESFNEMIRENAKNRSTHVLCVHRDGKQQSAPENKFKKIDRLSVLVSGYQWHQLLGVPRLERGTGEGQAEAVYKYLKEWELLDDVSAMVFDTTASNTGPSNGACILLERLVGRDLLYLACRHHVLELLLKTVYESAMGCTSGPGVPIFKRFQGQWENLNRGEFSPGIHDPKVKKALLGDMPGILAFAESQLKLEMVRMDYREFLELVVMFLGGNLEKGNRFRALGPIHHARWMAKAIYSLKIFLFRDQFYLAAQEKSGLMDTCIFIVLAYQKAWFTASHAVSAPNNDLDLLKQLAVNASGFNPVSSKTWKAVLDKFMTHLWYLSEELIGFAFFDDNVTLDCKREMCSAIKSRCPLNDDRKNRRTGINDWKLIPDLTLDSFVTQKTIKFFEILGINYGFLESDPITWKNRDDFATAAKIVNSLHVTNDIAERSVALVSEYNDLLTKDESSKQQLMLVVDKFRELSPTSTREDLWLSLEKYLNNQSTETFNVYNQK